MNIPCAEQQPFPENPGKTRFALANILCVAFATTMAWGQLPTGPAPLETSLRAPQLTVQPDELVFDALDVTHNVTVRREGIPVASSEFGKPRLMAGASDYARMIICTPSTEEPGVITIKLNPDTCEVGSYELQLPVGKDYVSVLVYTPLSRIKSIVDQDAAKLGSLEAAKLEHGLAQFAGREKLEIALPPEYKVGQTLLIELPKNPNRVYRWLLNGKVVLEGVGESTFKHPFQQPGDYAVGLVETEGAARIVSWSGTTRVTGVATDDAPIEWKVAAGQTFRVPAPKGYETYEWTIDGKPADGGATLTHVFNAKGTYAIECRCSAPVDAQRPAERRVTWRTIVE